MKPAPQQQEKVLCDLHAHPTHKADLEEILQQLRSPRLVGLTVKDIDKSGRDILRYEQALDLLPSGSFSEIDKGNLARCGDGYFARTQEIQVGKHHVLALGWQGDYFSNYDTIEEAVGEIHGRKGIALLNHPFALVDNQTIRLPNSEEEQQLIRKAYRRVDEVEVYNAHCLDVVPVLLAMGTANDFAETLRQKEFPRFKGTAGSDCHRRWEQVKTVGIYVAQDWVESGIGRLKTAICQGHFERYGDYPQAYISRWSWIRGVAGDFFSLLR